jgi:type I restriction enzyme, S subunit
VDAPSDGDVFVIDTEKTITQKGIEESSTKILPEGATIISARGTVGRLALVGRPMAMNQSCYGLSPANGATPAFLYFSAQKAVLELQVRAHGSVFDTITRETLDSISAVKPDIPIIQTYEKVAGALLQKIKGNLLEIRELAKQRDYLLPKLISGEIRIPDAKKFVECL